MTNSTSCIQDSALQDIIKLFTLSARQGDFSDLPDASYLYFFLSPFLKPAEKEILHVYLEKQLGDVKLRDFSKPFMTPVVDSVKALHLGRMLTKSLDQHQKLILVVLLMEQARIHKTFSANRMEMVRAVAGMLGIEKMQLNKLSEFIFHPEFSASEDAAVLYATGNEPSMKQVLENVNHIRIKFLVGWMTFYRPDAHVILFRSSGSDKISVNGYPVTAFKTYLLRSGDELLINGYPFEQASIIERFDSPHEFAPFHIEATQLTMEIRFIPSEPGLYLSGSSVPEDGAEFFQPLLLWLDRYTSSPPKNFTIHFRLDFFNTISSKFFLELLKRIERRVPPEMNVKVKWYYEPGDEDILEAGENYAYIVKIPFEMIAIAEHTEAIQGLK